MSKKNETAAILFSQSSPLGVKTFLLCKNFLLFQKNLHSSWPRWLKRSTERFHMTSRRPYWCSKTMRRQPCWFSKPVLLELNSFSCVNNFVCSHKFAWMLATWVKTLYNKVLQYCKNQSESWFVNLLHEIALKRERRKESKK